jgi:hypothetical protein
LVDLNPLRTKPYTPQPNGKAERYGLRPTSSRSNHPGGMDLRDRLPDI